MRVILRESVAQLQDLKLNHEFATSLEGGGGSGFGYNARLIKKSRRGRRYLQKYSYLGGSCLGGEAAEAI
jgi:hypothetical protein